MRRRSGSLVGRRLRLVSLRLRPVGLLGLRLRVVTTEGVGILARVAAGRSGGRLRAGLVVRVVVLLPVGSIIVSSGALVLGLRLVLRLWLGLVLRLCGRIVLRLGLVLRLRSGWGGGGRRNGQMVSGSLEAVLAGGVGYCPALTAEKVKETLTTM